MVDKDITRDDAKRILRARKTAEGGRGHGVHATLIKEADADTLRRAATDPSFYDRAVRAGKDWRLLLQPVPNGDDHAPMPVYEPRVGEPSAEPSVAPGLRSLVSLLEEAEGALRHNSDELRALADRIKRALS